MPIDRGLGFISRTLNITGEDQEYLIVIITQNICAVSRQIRRRWEKEKEASYFRGSLLD
jgi:hypothetical protein